MDVVIQGILHTLEWRSIFMILAGSVVGIVFGLIPGLQAVTALGIFLPISFWWDPVLAMYFFAGIIGACSHGGSVTSILLNIPGTAGSVCTMFEGYPMTRQGRGVYALNIAASASWFGAIFGYIALIALIPVFLPILYKFGPAETFWVAVAGLVTMIMIMSTAVMKGVVAIGIGIVLSCIGFGGPGLAAPRLTYGSSYLMDGLNLVVVVLGLLVFSEVIENFMKGRSISANSSAIPVKQPRIPLPEAVSQIKEGVLAPFRHFACFIRGSWLGTFVGILPGIGGSVTQFMVYNMALVTAKEPEKFGKGSTEGLVATEAGVNSKEGGSLLPTLLFGIPGSAEMALVLGAWQLHGLNPGPTFLANYGEVAVALILGLLISNTIASLATVGGSVALIRITNIDIRLVSIPVMLASTVAVYSIAQNFWDVVLVFLIGILGFLQKLYGYPVVATVIGFVLGRVIEANYYFALQSSLGSYDVFFRSTTSIVLIAVCFVAAIWSVIQLRKRSRVQT